MKPVCVILDGPFPRTDRGGDEVPYWPVCAADDAGEPVGTVYECSDFARAERLARKIAKDRRLELVVDGRPE